MSYETKLKEIEASHASNSADKMDMDAPVSSHGDETTTETNDEGRSREPGEGEANQNEKRNWSDSEREAHGLKKRMEKMMQRQKMMQQRIDELQGANKKPKDPSETKSRKDFANDSEYASYIRESAMNEIANGVFERYEKQMAERQAAENIQREFSERLTKDLPQNIVAKIHGVLTDDTSEQMEILQSDFGSALQSKIMESPIGTHILGLFASKPHIFEAMAKAPATEWPMKLTLLEHDMMRYKNNANDKTKENEAKKRADSVPVTGGFGRTDGSVGENLENMNLKERIAKLQAMYRSKR